jgi:hypothetical protein
MKPNQRRWTPLAWLAAGLIVAVAPWAAAEDTASPAGDETTSQAGDETAQQEAQPAAAGLTVFIDPQTGELTDQPTAEQTAALAEKIRRSWSKTPEDLKTFELNHGGHGIFLGGSLQKATVVRIRPDGSFEIRCTDHPDEAAVLPAAPLLAAPPQQVEK